MATVYVLLLELFVNRKRNKFQFVGNRLERKARSLWDVFMTKKTFMVLRETIESFEDGLLLQYKNSCTDLKM